jgi:putative membrane protein
MIVRPRPDLLALVIVMRGSVIIKAAPRVLAMTVFAGGVAWLARLWPQAFERFTPTPFTLFGIALSIFLSFRNNACYERWWEARKAWGQAVIEARSLARQTQDLDLDVRRRLLRDVCAFAHGLAAQMRGHDAIAASASWSPATLTNDVNVCDAILTDAGGVCLEQASTGCIDGWRYQLLEARLSGLSAVQAICERIKTTPVPFAYSLLLHRTAYLFCLMLPFGWSARSGWARR